MHWSEACAYVYRMSVTAMTSLRVAWQKSRESSANNKWEILGALLHIETQCIRSSNFAFANKAVKPFAHKRNK